MQVATLDKLQREGCFRPEQAIVVAEAIDMAVAEAQFVTVPILDARFAQVDARFARVDAQFAQVDAQFAQVDAQFAQLGARFDVLEARMDAKLQAMKGELEGKLASLKIQLIVVVVVSSAAVGPLGVKILNALVSGHWAG
jgi:hypothetical protein